MYELKNMKECLMAYVWPQLKHLDQVDAKELGEAIDMIKDLEEAIYYCTITKAMEQQPQEENGYRRYYGEGKWDRNQHHMPQQHVNDSWGEEWDWREGRSPKSRKMYMEAKQMHHGKTSSLHELEKYMKELTDDIIEMIEDATPEEKELLSNKLSGLAARIDN